jgi:alkylation response protein AidB-like acyl-CoA dehydrogenase
VEAATAEQPIPPQQGVSSFAKSLFLGEIHEELVFPFPKPDEAEQRKTVDIIRAFREFADENIDPRKIEEDRWIGDKVIAGLGELGVCGLYVPEEYGGQGLSQTGYCRVSEVFAQVDATLSVVMGVHQSIGMKGIVLYGSDEQKERYLPDLASARKLAGFALTEPSAGSPRSRRTGARRGSRFRRRRTATISAASSTGTCACPQRTCSARSAKASRSPCTSSATDV